MKIMGSRRQARENALQMLYQIEMSDVSLEEVFENFWAHHPGEDLETKKFAQELVTGVLKEKQEIDALIVQHATNWKLSRMPCVDKNLLRLAVHELKNCKEIPIKVALNEAIEIAKKFGSEESGSFINGVLDKIARELKRE